MPKIPSTVKFPAKTLEKLQKAHDETGIPVAELIRMCAAIGLRHLEKIDYDIHGSVLQASNMMPEKKSAPQKKEGLTRTRSGTKLKALESPQEEITRAGGNS